MQQSDYHLRINDKYDVFLDEAAVERLDIVSPQRGVFHVLENGRKYEARLKDLDFRRKTIRIEVNGLLYVVRLNDAYDELVEKMGLSATVIHKIKDVRAPMPGLVLDIMVEPGQTVTHGDPLLVLEAMKMENVIKSPGEGTIKQIHVLKGSAVDKGAVLIELE